MAMTYADLVARNIRAARARVDLPQLTVSKRMKGFGFTSWSPSKVSECERAVRPVTTSELLALAVSLETTLAALVGAAPEDGPIDIGGEWEIGAVSVLNLSHGIPDPAVSWAGPKRLDLSITMPSGPTAVSAWNKTFYQPV